MILTRQEKESLVIDLYNQGKNTREIAQQVGMSFRDIGAILQKAAKEKEKDHYISISSKAYAMFSEGKSQIQIAIALNLREAEVTKFYTEFCNLNNLRALGQVYNEIKGDIAYFLELYRLTKAAGMNTQDIKRILEIAHRDLSSIEYRYRALQREISSLEAEKRNSARIFQELKTRDSLHSSCRELGLEITKLRIQKIRLEAAVNKIQNDTETHNKIKEIAKREVERFLGDRQLIFKLTFESIIKSMRKDPDMLPNSYHNITRYPIQLPNHPSHQELTVRDNNEIDVDY
jgi:hypothetical protein